MPPSQALANGPLLPDVSQTRDVGFPTGANELSMSAWKKGWLTDPLSSVMYCHNLRYFFRWNFLLVFVQISYSESAKQQLREAAEKAVSYLCLKEKVDPQIMTTVCARAFRQVRERKYQVRQRQKISFVLSERSFVDVFNFW